MTPLEYARWYRERGLSVFPCKPRDKTPLLESWKAYQTELPTLTEIDGWWTEVPTAIRATPWRRTPRETPT